MKILNLQKYIDDFKQLSFSIVYSFDNPDDQPDTVKVTSAAKLFFVLKQRLMWK